MSRASAENRGHPLLLENSQTNNQSRNFSNDHNGQPINHSYNADGDGRFGDENDADEGNMDVDDDLN